MREIVYSTKPVTLKEAIWSSRCGSGDLEALALLIEARTNLSGVEALNLEIDDIMMIATKIIEGINMAATLSSLSKQLES